MFRRIASLGYKVVLTTDHGTTRVTNAVQIIGDKNTNTNLRYKVGKALNCQSKNCFEITRHSLYSLETFDICQNSNSEPYGFVYIF